MAKLAVVTTDQSMVSPAPDTLTPARARLAQHLDAVDKAAAEIGRSRMPFDKILAQLRTAETVQREVESELAAIDGEDAGALAAWAAAGDGSPEPAPQNQRRAKATAALQAAERAAATAGHALSFVEPTVKAAQSRHIELLAKTDEFVISVLVDESEAARARLAEAQTAAIAAEATVRGLQVAITERANAVRAKGADPLPWLRAGELLAVAFGAMQRPDLTYAATQRCAATWAALIAALPADSTAAVT